MNERIRELMLLAGTDTSGKWMGVEHAERFAELIVNQCADIAQQHSATRPAHESSWLGVYCLPHSFRIIASAFRTESYQCVLTNAEQNSTHFLSNLDNRL